MPRKTVTRKQINETMSKVAESYFKASNCKGLSEDTRTFLTNKWALFREVAYMLSTQDRKTLEGFEFDASGWLVSCEAVEKEIAK